MIPVYKYALLMVIISPLLGSEFPPSDSDIRNKILKFEPSSSGISLELRVHLFKSIRDRRLIFEKYLNGGDELPEESISEIDSIMEQDYHNLWQFGPSGDHDAEFNRLFFTDVDTPFDTYWNEKNSRKHRANALSTKGSKEWLEARVIEAGKSRERLMDFKYDETNLDQLYSDIMKSMVVAVRDPPPHFKNISDVPADYLKLLKGMGVSDWDIMAYLKIETFNFEDFKITVHAYDPPRRDQDIVFKLQKDN